MTFPISTVDGPAVVWRWSATLVVPQYQVVRSPANGLTYERITAAGSSATDPSVDPTNYALVGPTKLKSLQRGVVTVNAGSLTGTATISAVNTAKARLRFLGGGASVAWGNNTTYGCRLSLGGSTSVVLELPGTLAGTYQATFEINEEW